MWIVLESRKAEKQIDRLPIHLLKRYEKWKDIVAISGIDGLKQIKGFYDHALSGNLKAHRSSYLNEAYRVIYHQDKDRILIKVLEVNAHNYKIKGMT